MMCIANPPSTNNKLFFFLLYKLRGLVLKDGESYNEGCGGSVLALAIEKRLVIEVCIACFRD